MFKFRRYQKFAPAGTLAERLVAWRQEELRVRGLHWTYFDQRDWDALYESAVSMLFEIFGGGLSELERETRDEVTKWRSHRLCTPSERSWSNDWAFVLTRAIADTLSADAKTDSTPAAHEEPAKDGVALDSQRMRIYVSHAAPGLDPSQPPKDWFVVQPIDAPEEQVESLIKARRTVVAFDIDPYLGQLVEVGPVASAG